MQTTTSARVLPLLPRGGNPESKSEIAISETLFKIRAEVLSLEQEISEIVSTGQALQKEHPEQCKTSKEYAALSPHPLKDPQPKTKVGPG